MKKKNLLKSTIPEHLKKNMRHTDVSETGGHFFNSLANLPKNHGFRSKFQNYTEIVLVDEFHRNLCQNEGLGWNFQEKL